jgi:hypothetical protein
MAEWRRKQELQGKVLKALHEQPTLGDFMQAAEAETDYPLDLRGANPVLAGDGAGRCNVRLNRLGLRRQFWLRLVTGWQDDFAELAEDQGTDALPHLWRGLVGRRLAKAERPLVRAFAEQAGVVEVAQALCAVVTETPEDTPAHEVFQRFSERCRALVEELQRQVLPPSAFECLVRRRAISFGRDNPAHMAPGIGGESMPAVDDLLLTFAARQHDGEAGDGDEPAGDGVASPRCHRPSFGHRNRARKRAAMAKAGTESGCASAPRLVIMEGGIVDHGADPG